MFFVLALLGSLTSLAPKSAAADLSNTGPSTDPDSAIKKGATRAPFLMAEPEGFEPSIRLFNRITV